MILCITHSCHMNCSHCMIDATPNGKHMSFAVLNQALAKIVEWQPLVILISGGEPTDHPQFFEFMNQIQYVLSNSMNARPWIPVEKRLMVISNGMFTQSPNWENEYGILPYLWQIVNDPKYYPISIPDPQHHNIEYFDNIPGNLFPAGRAPANHGPIAPRGPFCGNLRNLIRNHNMSLAEAMDVLQGFGKSCVPTIQPDGTIRLGETPSCYSIGSVHDTEDQIRQNILNMKCNACGLYDFQPVSVRRLVGE